jgi:hypothetical protein
MSVTTEVLDAAVQGPVTAAGPVDAGGARRFRRVVASEWIKFRSLRSSRLALLAVVIGVVGIAALAAGTTAARWSTMAPKDRADLDPTGLSLNGWFLGQLVVGVLGVLTVTSEYGSRMIRTTFAAVPQRRLVLAAKAVVVGVIVLVVGMATSLIAFGVAQAFLASTGHAVSLSDPGELRAVLGAGLYAATIAMLGLGVGTIVRSTAGSVSALFGLLFVPPILAELFPGGWHRAIQRYSPMNAGSRVLMTQSQANALGPWAGLAVLMAYTAVIGIIAFWLVARRDA